MPATFEREESLPKLPLPSLNSSIEQALFALQPLVTEEDFVALNDEANTFLSSEQAHALQLHLAKFAEENNNYMNSHGISSTTSNVYGDLRGQTLPRNPFFILEDDPSKNVAPTQEYRAAVLTISTLRFIMALKFGNLKSDVNPITQEPQTMSSYHNLFSTCVTPHGAGVEMKKYLNSKHVVFMSHGQFYTLPVLSDNDQIWFSKHELSAIIKKIIYHSTHSHATHNNEHVNVGTFTSETKSTWKAARVSLEKSNPDQMRLIDSALFIVSLDHENFQNMKNPLNVVTDTDADIDNDNDNVKIQYVSHGTSRIDKNGTQYGTCINRYYDKLNLVVTKNATAACIYPASIIDGTTVLRFISDVYTDSVLRLARMINGKNYTLWTEINTVPINNEIVKPTFQHITFKLTNEISNGLHLAESRLADIINQHEYVAKKIPIGKNYIKNKMKLPCDSFIQLCIQITYYALYGKCPSTFEPVSTRKFRDARTEPICIQNQTLLNLCQAFISQTSDAEKWKLFLSAIKIHKESAIAASNGQGFERHLSALRSAFIQSGTINDMNPALPPIDRTQIPPFIFNPLLEALYKPELIAANCGNPALDYFGITPSIPSGFGFGYIIKDGYITIVGSSQWRQTGRFLETLERVAFHIKQIWKTVVVGGGATAEVNNVGRDKELQEYISSIPMSLIKSNNSWLPAFTGLGVTASTASTSTAADAYILGGYDYFDVGQLNSRSRSELASKAQSRALSRVASQANLSLGKTASFRNVGQARETGPPHVGRLLSLQSDL